MKHTGRIQTYLTPTARRILFGNSVDEKIEVELAICAQIDQAHLIMLAEQGAVDSAKASQLIRAIRILVESNFADIRGREAVRGWYLLYENYLMEKLGPRVGGIIQLGRSRNDLNATIFRLSLRRPYLRLLSESMRLQAILLRRALKHSRVVMPAYTHYQAAVPITYGHYLAGAAGALERDIVGLLEAGAGLEYSPLGAGSVGGATIPIDQSRTAALLGFTAPVRNSVDAVASRDLALRLLAGAVILGVTLSRLAADLLLWSTSEFAFITLPDDLVGSSSMMPQKRNPFLLEHAQGRTTFALGAFTAATTAMHAKPFTNSISVGTEATESLNATLNHITEASILIRLVIAGAQPQPERMFSRAVDGFTSATELANRLATCGELSFREAHHTVGNYIREAMDQEKSLANMAIKIAGDHDDKVSLDNLDPLSIAMSSEYGGGPGIESLTSSVREHIKVWRRHRELNQSLRRRWRAADILLEAAARRLCEMTTNPSWPDIREREGSNE
jgi:argininosuccinate lyase